MEHVQKMALVDPKLLTQLQSKSVSQPTIKEIQISSLDKEMNDIANDLSIDEFAKVKLYNQVLRRYRFYISEQEHPSNPLSVIRDINLPPLPPSNPMLSPSQTISPIPSMLTKTQPEEINEIWSKDIITSLPTTARVNGERMIDSIKSSSNIEVNDQGELKIKGKTIPGSNIRDLIHDFVRRRKISQKPKGWDYFGKALKAERIPSTLIGSKTHREWMFPSPGKIAARARTWKEI